MAIATIGTVVGGAVLPGLFKTGTPLAEPSVVSTPAPVATKQEGELDVEAAINDFLKSTESK